MVTEELRRDVWTCLKSGPFLGGRNVIGVSGTFHLVGAPADALRHVAEECADFAGVVLLWWHPRPFLLEWLLLM